MNVGGTTLLPSKDAGEKTRQQLQRILDSKSFSQVVRLQGFLTFIVEELLAGRGDKLKEFPIAVEVFDRDLSFDPRMDQKQTPASTWSTWSAAPTTTIFN